MLAQQNRDAQSKFRPTFSFLTSKNTNQLKAQDKLAPKKVDDKQQKPLKQEENPDSNDASLPQKPSSSPNIPPTKLVKDNPRNRLEYLYSERMKLAQDRKQKEIEKQKKNEETQKKSPQSSFNSKTFTRVSTFTAAKSSITVKRDEKNSTSLSSNSSTPSSSRPTSKTIFKPSLNKKSSTQAVPQLHSGIEQNLNLASNDEKKKINETANNRSETDQPNDTEFAEGVDLPLELSNFTHFSLNISESDKQLDSSRSKISYSINNSPNEPKRDDQQA